MTPEERVREYYLWVLNRIKEDLLTTPKGELIRYDLSHVGAAGVPNNETESNIIRKLEEWTVLKIIRERPFQFEVLYPKFDEIYQKFQKSVFPINNEKSDLEINEPSEKIVPLVIKNIPIKVTIADLKFKFNEILQ
ncbi:hypothetical protein A3E42_02515 [Candidatus Gottesmanbacteria bacterium RIFCSPHIGHO2_12_FULL_40_13]|uniref:Uncharacterized protein n=1 Tax=Candidatus Gottesmanbacteria bacterium RIFCSPHIGHO2_01_FULL_40_15 TaxID=1798376 RepID=A0A1F5Z6Q0_9BACT|nr:MAG: hypothetical protein A2777_03225 [Candidatus Gottesmanbacteria bacterium RIFCSPHIGHO2_01_FULL_40_15]OGG25008.1 MAG: hypothetical protein A3E42_02515 [Candidatus Gottesmanbacteria bacterium RIFCSPHIGHO2_12_FULL_40_13]